MKRLTNLRLALGASVVATLLGVSEPAWASEVTLVAPAPGDGFIEEVFHRVGGELRLQGIDYEQREGEGERACPQALGSAPPRAIACIVFAWQGEASVVRIWVTQPGAKTPALFEAVALQRSVEAPTLLATRTVDLLQGALAVRAPELSRPSESAPAKAAEPPQPQEHESRAFAFGAGLSELGAPSRFGAAWGPHLELSWRSTERWRLRARLLGPLLGASAGNAEASAQLTQGLGQLSVDVRLASLGPCALTLNWGMGAHFIRARGKVALGVASLDPKTDDHWSPAALGGLEVSVALGSRLTWVAGGQALLLWPRPRVLIGHEWVRLGQPQLLLASGLRFGG